MVATVQELETGLADFDGKAVSVLTELRASIGQEPDYLIALISLMGNGTGCVSDGATWLIKDALEAGITLSMRETPEFIQRLAALKSWAGILHACQSFQYLNVSEADARIAEPWLRALLDHDRPFIRAWSLDALCRLAEMHAEYQNAAEAALRQAESDASASVRARARNLQKILAG